MWRSSLCIPQCLTTERAYLMGALTWLDFIAWFSLTAVHVRVPPFLCGTVRLAMHDCRVAFLYLNVASFGVLPAVVLLYPNLIMLLAIALF